MKAIERLKIPVVLTIAGSDPSGGAGIQADVKVFNEFCVYSMAVVTSLTSQNTVNISSVYHLDKKFFTTQLEACLSDIKPDAFKTGMISMSFMPQVIADFIINYGLKNYVLDPVMIASSGSVLCDRKTSTMIIKYLFPYALLITPNINEAEYFSGIKINSIENMIKASRIIKDMGPANVLVKGGHLDSDEIVDVLLLKNGELRFFKHRKVKNLKTHGTGCTLSSAVVALLAKGYSLEESVKKAIDYTVKSIQSSIKIGSGALVLNHFWRRFKLKY